MAPYVLVCFSEQLEDMDSNNVKGSNLSAKGSLEEMGPVPMLYTYDVKRKTCKRLSVKAFVCFHLKNIRSDAPPRV